METKDKILRAGVAISIIMAAISLCQARILTIDSNRKADQDINTSSPRVFVSVTANEDTGQILLKAMNQGAGPAIEIELVYSIEPIWSRFVERDDASSFRGDTIIEMNGEHVVTGRGAVELVAAERYVALGGKWRSEVFAAKWDGLHPQVGRTRKVNIYSSLEFMEEFFRARFEISRTPGYDIESYRAKRFVMSAIAVHWTVKYSDLAGDTFEESGVGTLIVSSRILADLFRSQAPRTRETVGRVVESRGML